MPPPAVILGTPVVHAEGGTTGVSGIQRNKGPHLGTPAKHQQGLTGEKRLRLPPGTSRAMTGGGEMTVGATGDSHWIARNKPGNDGAR